MADDAPGRRSPAEIAIGSAILVMGIAVVVSARSLAGGQNYALVGPDMMPLLVGVGLTVLGAVLLWQALSGGFRNGEPDDPAVRGEHAFIPSAFLWVLAGMGAQMVLMPIGGFVLAAAGLFVCVARGFGSRRWLRDLLVGFAIGLAIFLFFVHLLNVSLPAGLLLPLLGTAGI